MATVTAPLCVSTPPASYARMVMVRSEPAGSVMMPSATRSVTEILKTILAAMSGAVTSTTTVATVVPERSALTSRVVSAGRDRDPVGSLGKQEPSANRDAIAAATRTGTVPGTRKPPLRRNTNRRGPSNSSESGRYRRVARPHRRHQSGSVHDSDTGVVGGPTDGPARRIPIPVRDRGRQLHGCLVRERVERRCHCDRKGSQRHGDRQIPREGRQRQRDRGIG